MFLLCRPRKAIRLKKIRFLYTLGYKEVIILRFWLKNKSAGFSPDSCEKYRDYLFNIALHITKDKSYAEDVVQETMYKLIKIAPKLADKTEEYVKKYMVRAVINNAFTYISKTLHEIPVENLFDNVAIDIVMEEILAAETREHLTLALAKLTSKQRMVLVLMFYENWTSEHIAAYLGITADGVRMLKKRGLENMREILIQEGWDK